MTGLELAVCGALLAVVIGLALIVDRYERRLEHARWQLARMERDQ